VSSLPMGNIQYFNLPNFRYDFDTNLQSDNYKVIARSTATWQSQIEIASLRFQ